MALRHPWRNAACACLAAIAWPGAQAQQTSASRVEIYGIVDAAVEVLDNVGPGRNALKRMPTNTASTPSRLGLRGSEDLGDGLRAVFTLEMGLGLDGGTLGQGGRAFGRQAYVGLANPWGTLSFGRQYTMLLWAIVDAGVLGPNAFGHGAIDPYFPNARADNSLAYRGSFGGLTVGATYSPGRDAVNAGPSPAGTNCAGESATDAKACREMSLMLKYDAAQWGTAAAVDRLYGGPGAFDGLTSSSLRDTRSMVNAYWKFAGGKLATGYMLRQNDGRPIAKSRLYFLGASYNLTAAWQLEGEFFRYRFKESDNGAALLALRATYFLSKRTAAYFSAGHMRNEGALALSVSCGQPGGNPLPGQSQSGLMAGIRHSF